MNTETLSIIVGQFMPMVIEIINNYVPNHSKIRYIVSLLVSVIVGGITTYFAGELGGEELLASVALVFASSQTAYRMWFKGSSVESSFQR